MNELDSGYVLQGSKYQIIKKLGSVLAEGQVTDISASESEFPRIDYGVRYSDHIDVWFLSPGIFY